jgi:hypothetical protein
MKLCVGVLMLIVFALAVPAYAELKVTVLETTALDAAGNRELHLLLCGIPMLTTALRVQNYKTVEEIPWSWKSSTADLWLAIGKWETLILQILYTDNSRDTVTIKASAKVETSNSWAKCDAGNLL